MTKTAILASIMKLAGFEKIKIDLEKLDTGVEYKGYGERLIDNEWEPLEFQAIGFEFALADLLARLYDTTDIDFETNAAIQFG
ncbi:MULTISPECIES: hypothetical protein [Chryseobacterium]|uniref:Uncharacterized protein n=1 Tax=Candidatus Chryseobacterium massiliense TaxID=204089 RepID=A0A3D9B3C6_9FLAO|nr:MULTISPECIES: hypothetical protein [Chryseobacterium]REC47848.1 hypothetical protein DRF68_12465 [Candidatus Chryseobacterium massiliae]